MPQDYFLSGMRNRIVVLIFERRVWGAGRGRGMCRERMGGGEKKVEPRMRMRVR